MLSAPLLDAIGLRAAAMPPRVLAEAVAALSAGYRRDPSRPHANLWPEALRIAYLAARMPATAAAVGRALAHATQAAPFSPRTHLDLGAGPGTAAFVAREAFPSIGSVTLVEAVAAWEGDARQLARATGDAPIAEARWIAARIPCAIGGRFDLVTMAYALGELAPLERTAAIAHAWGATGGMLLLVEAGTPDGFARLLAARAQLLAAGAHLAAPCPHRGACPLAAAGEWCHQTVRLPRRRVHREAKGGDLGFEDEPFAYLAVARMPAPLPAARIVEPPVVEKGRLLRRLCEADGSLRRETVMKRDREAWAAASRADWGDAVPPWTTPG